MRKLMIHSAGVWESGTDGLSYHLIGYESVFIEGEQASTQYMRGGFADWRAQGITPVLHEKRGGHSNSTKMMYGLAQKVAARGVRIASGVGVTGFTAESGSASISRGETSKGAIGCGHVIIGAGLRVRDFWSRLGRPEQIDIRQPEVLSDNDGNAGRRSGDRPPRAVESGTRLLG